MWQWALIIMAPGNKGARNTWRSREAASLCCYPNKASSQILRRTRGDPEAVLLPALELSACLELLSQCCSMHSNPHTGTFRFPALMWNGHVQEEEETLPQADGDLLGKWRPAVACGICAMVTSTTAETQWAYLWQFKITCIWARSLGFV